MKNDINAILSFTKRNIKVFFKDKGTVIASLMAPLIILILYILFLHSVLISTFNASLPDGFELSKNLINGYAAAYEVSSLLAVTSITVAFIANMAMVDDRVNGIIKDLLVTPVKSHVLSIGYFLATEIITLVICYIAMGAGFIYLGIMGWELLISDVFLIIIDVLLATLFGTAFSSIISHFLHSKGAINAVSTIVSSIYGFICGAYYPLSQFSAPIRNTVMFLPGTYVTSLYRTHFMGHYYDAFLEAGLPASVADGVLDSLDGRIYFFGNLVEPYAMYLIVIGAIVLFLGIYVLLNFLQFKKVLSLKKFLRK